MTSRVVAERICACPFSVVEEYAAGFLHDLEVAPPRSRVRVPLRTLGLPLGGSLTHSVTLRFGIHSDATDVVRRHEAIVFTWRTGSKWLPSLSGALRFRIAPHGQTLMLFDGTYRPPLGLAGALFDRLIGHRIARATACDLLTRLGDSAERAEAAFRARHPASS